MAIPFGLGSVIAIPAYYTATVFGSAPFLMEVFGTGVEHSLHAYAAEIKHRLRVKMTDAVGVAVKSIGSGTQQAYATAELMSVFNELIDLPDAVDCSGLPMNQVLEGDASLGDWGLVLGRTFIVSALELTWRV